MMIKNIISLKIICYWSDDQIESGIFIESKIYSIRNINQKTGRNWPLNLIEIIQNDYLDEISKWYNNNKEELKGYEYINIEKLKLAPLYTKPSKIWGIGLNYVDHASDLNEKAPTSIPASFMKPYTTVIGFDDPIKIPKMSQKTTGEAELGVIIGKKCKDVKLENWKDVVAGYTTIIDMTTEDILRQNPRYLTVSKSFDTFFSFGPMFLTPDEIADISQLEVSTVINNEVWAKNTVSNMTFPPSFLVTFHSQVMTLLPGDIISTGTPKAVHINDGDKIECRITNFLSLSNPVEDMKITG